MKLKMDNNLLGKYLVILIAFSLSLPNFYFSLFFISFTIISTSQLFNCFKTKTSIFVIIILLHFLVLLLGLLNTKIYNISFGIQDILIRIPLIIFPIMISKIKLKSIDTILFSFSLGVIFGVIICLINVQTTPGVYGQIKQIYISNWYWNSRLVEPIDKHPTYFALYNIFSIFIVIRLILRKWGGKYRLFYLTPIGLLNFVVILTLESRMALFSLPIGLLIYFIYKINDKKIIALIVMSFIGIGFTYFLYHPAKLYNIRILKLNDDIGIRSNIYKSSFNLLKHNYIIGVGTGDVQESLNYQYRFDNFNLGLKKSLNSHNQYLEETLRNGIIGLLSLLFMILVPLYIALKNKNSFFITLFFFFLVFMLSECILNRQQGVSFVSLFLSLFILRLKKDNK